MIKCRHYDCWAVHKTEHCVYVVCGCTGTTVNIILLHLHAHLLLAGNDTVLISVWRSGDALRRVPCNPFWKYWLPSHLCKSPDRNRPVVVGSSHSMMIRHAEEVTDEFSMRPRWALQYYTKHPIWFSDGILEPAGWQEHVTVHCSLRINCTGKSCADYTVLITITR